MVRLIATKPKLSYLSTLIRFEQLYAINPLHARATPKAYHDQIVACLVDNLRQVEDEQIFERIQIYRRDRTCIYDSMVEYDFAVTILQSVLFGEWTAFELDLLHQSEQQLSQLRAENALK